MADVVSLVDYANRDTVAVLKTLLHRARNGEIDGLAVTFMEPEGPASAFTGCYRDPMMAARAALRMSVSVEARVGSSP